MFNVRYLVECSAKHNLLSILSILFSIAKFRFFFCVQMLSAPTLVEFIIICILVMLSCSWNEMFVLLRMIWCRSAKYGILIGANSVHLSIKWVTPSASWLHILHSDNSPWVNLAISTCSIYAPVMLHLPQFLFIKRQMMQ